MTLPDRQLRILYSFSDRLGSGGIGTTAWHQVDSLARAGHLLHVFCPSCERPLPKGVILRETLRPARLRLPLRRIGPLHPRFLHDWLTARALRALASATDVVHCWPSAALVTLGVATQYQIPTFLERPNTFTRHAFQVVARECDRLGLRLPRRHSHKFDYRRLAREEAEFRLASYLLCPSELVANTFLTAGFPHERIARHQYGYDPLRFYPPSQDRPRFGALRALFMGSCEPRKGLHYALDAWLMSEAADRGVFHIAGPFLSNYKRHLARQLDHPSIRLHGTVENAAELMRDCDVLVLPSIEEGSALVTYEARACGCVLLVSDATGAPCQHLQEGLVHRAGDAVTLARQLTTLARDPALLHHLRDASIAGCAALTWDAAVAVMSACYLGGIDAMAGRRNAGPERTVSSLVQIGPPGRPSSIQ